MKKILVTGGLGFIGSNLIDLLIKKKYFVINLDKVTYSSNFYNTKNYKNNKNYKFIKLDIGSKNLKKILFKFKPVCIFNLAAETHVDRSIDKPDDFIQSNFVSVYNLLECFKEFSKKNKSKLIHISTDEVYGDILNGRSHEKYPYQPSSPYAASKAASDHLVSSYVRTYGIPAIVTNCSNNYGPKQHPEKLIPKLIYNILNNKSLPIYGNGKNSREWIYVQDHCEALIKVAKKDHLIGSNVMIKFVKDRPGHDIRYALDSKKILRTLRWKTKVSFEKGLEKTFLWYLHNNNYYKSISKKDIIKRLGTK